MANISAVSSGDVMTVLAVRLGDDLYSIPIKAVEEVLPALPIESLPACPKFVRGVVFVRGQLIPVVGAAERLGLDGYERPLEPHIVCLRAGDRLIGVEFDEALGLMEIKPGELLDAHTIGASKGFFLGVTEHEGRMIRLLAPEMLIAAKEARELDQVPDTA